MNPSPTFYLFCGYAGFRYVSRDGVPLLGLGVLELFEEDENPQLLARCAVWYGGEALVEWARRGGVLNP